MEILFRTKRKVFQMTNCKKETESYPCFLSKRQTRYPQKCMIYILHSLPSFSRTRQQESKEVKPRIHLKTNIICIEYAMFATKKSWKQDAQASCLLAEFSDPFTSFICTPSKQNPPGFYSTGGLCLLLLFFTKDYFFCALPISRPFLKASTFGGISFCLFSNLCSIPLIITSSGTASVYPT